MGTGVPGPYHKAAVTCSPEDTTGQQSPLPTFVLKRRIHDLDAPLSAPRDPQHIQGVILSLEAQQVLDTNACG